MNKTMDAEDGGLIDAALEASGPTDGDAALITKAREVEALRKTLVATEESRQYWLYAASEENKVADALRAENARLREAIAICNAAATETSP